MSRYRARGRGVVRLDPGGWRRARPSRCPAVHPSSHNWSDRLDHWPDGATSGNVASMTDRNDGTRTVSDRAGRASRPEILGTARWSVRGPGSRIRATRSPAPWRSACYRVSSRRATGCRRSDAWPSSSAPVARWSARPCARSSNAGSSMSNRVVAPSSATIPGPVGSSRSTWSTADAGPRRGSSRRPA